MEETTLNSNLDSLLEKLQLLINDFWGFAIAILSAIVLIWSVYVGVKLIVAHRNEERIDSKRMIKNLIIGIIIIFVLAVGIPLLIDGLRSWAGI